MKLARAFALFVLLSLVGCVGKPKKRQPTLRLNFALGIKTFDPRKVHDETSANLINMVHEGLLRANPDGTLGPGIAEHYKVSEDGLTYTFFLRDATWSDGTPITAYDFEYSWKRILCPSFATQAKAKFYVIRGAEAAATGRGSIDGVGVHALSKKRLQVELKQPTSYFLHLVAMCNYFPVRAGIDETAPKWLHEVNMQAFTGPFILKEYSPKQCLILEKNPEYWDAEAVKIDLIEISMIADPHTEIELFDQGELDWAGHPLSAGLPLDALEPMYKRGLLKTSDPTKLYLYLFNAKTLPFNNDKMRQAFCHAICRKEIIDCVAGGNSQPALSFIPAIYTSTSRNLFSDGDLEKARLLFAEALNEIGLDKASFPKVTIDICSSPVQTKIAQVVAQQWKQAFGIEVHIERSSWKTYLSKINSRSYQVLCSNWFPYIPDPMCFLSNFDSTHEDMTGWVDANYSSLLRAAMRCESPEERARIVSDAEQRLVLGMPAAPLYYNGSTYLISDRLQNVCISQFNIVEFKWAEFTPDGDAL